jgi:hypothetical protein
LILRPPRRLIAVLLKRPNPTTLFRRDSSSPANANRIEPLWLKRTDSFQPDLMFPAVLEIVFVQKPFAEAEAEIRQADLIGLSVEDRSTYMVHAEILAMDPETIEVAVAPAESELERIMEVRNTLVGTNQEPTPDQWANAA